MASACPSNLRTLLAACAAITVFGLARGMTYPLRSLILGVRVARLAHPGHDA